MVKMLLNVRDQLLRKFFSAGSEIIIDAFDHGSYCSYLSVIYPE